MMCVSWKRVLQAEESARAKALPQSEQEKDDTVKSDVLERVTKSDYSFFFPFIFISWRLITLQYCSGFCHILT